MAREAGSAPQLPTRSGPTEAIRGYLQRSVAAVLQVVSCTLDTFPDDQRAIVAEIASEADRERSESSEPATDEAEIIAAFKDLAPAGAMGDDGRSLIARLGEVTHIDVDVPTHSNRALLAPIKHGLRKTQAWYLRYVADQVNVAFALTTSALDNHEERLSLLDSRRPPADLGIEPSPTPSADIIRVVADSMVRSVDAINERDRRILSAWSGKGEFIDTLVGSGFDAYGVEPASDKVSESLRKGLDSRKDDPLDHLAELAPGSLGAVVLGSALDTMPVAIIANALDLARRAVCSGGVVVVLADTTPEDPVRFELAGRRPLSRDAWLRLMDARQISAAIALPTRNDLTVFIGQS